MFTFYNKKNVIYITENSLAFIFFYYTYFSLFYVLSISSSLSFGKSSKIEIVFFLVPFLNIFYYKILKIIIEFSKNYN